MDELKFLKEMVNTHDYKIKSIRYYSRNNTYTIIYPDDNESKHFKKEELTSFLKCLIRNSSPLFDKL